MDDPRVVLFVDNTSVGALKAISSDRFAIIIINIHDNNNPYIDIELRVGGEEKFNRFIDLHMLEHHPDDIDNTTRYLFIAAHALVVYYNQNEDNDITKVQTAVENYFNTEPLLRA